MRIDRAFFLTCDETDPEKLPQSGWRELPLPHQWSLEGIEAQTGWYALDLPPAKGRRWLELSADYFCEAWLDNRPLGDHEGYFAPWVFEVPAGRRLLVRVSAPHEEYPSVWPRFKRQIKGIFSEHDCRPGGTTPHGQDRGTGGIWGDIELRNSGPVSLLYLGWRAVPVSTGWKLIVAREIDALSEADCDCRLVLAPQNFAAESHARTRSLHLSAGRRQVELVWDLPDLPRWDSWDQGFPHLYSLSATIEEQTREVPVGFRTLEQDGDWLRLNGRRIFLRGSNIIPSQWLAGYSDEQAERDADLIKEANLNAVRVHAHLTHPGFYDACDRAGILIWQDFPLQWGYATDEEFYEQALKQARAMVRHFGCHPSIYLWCAHNEPIDNRTTLDPVIGAELRAADPSRLVKEASSNIEHAYPGWYRGPMGNFQSLPGAPLPSEFGAQALPRKELLERALGKQAWPPNLGKYAYHNFQPHQTLRVVGLEPGEDLESFIERSQHYQAELIKYSIETYRQAKGRITGYFHFMFVDGWESISWSVLDVDRVPKLGYEALRLASRPILITLTPYCLKPELGQPPVKEAWIISDLPEAMTLDVSLRLEGEAEILLFRENLILEANGCRNFFNLSLVQELPPVEQRRYARAVQELNTLPAGEYTLIGEAYRESELVTRNTLTFTYLDPMLPREDSFRYSCFIPFTPEEEPEA